MKQHTRQQKKQVFLFSRGKRENNAVLLLACVRGGGRGGGEGGGRGGGEREGRGRGEGGGEGREGGSE